MIGRLWNCEAFSKVWQYGTLAQTWAEEDESSRYLDLLLSPLVTHACSALFTSHSQSRFTSSAWSHHTANYWWCTIMFVYNRKCNVWKIWNEEHIDFFGRISVFCLNVIILISGRSILFWLWQNNSALLLAEHLCSAYIIPTQNPQQYIRLSYRLGFLGRVDWLWQNNSVLLFAEHQCSWLSLTIASPNCLYQPSNPEK